MMELTEIQILLLRQRLIGGHVAKTGCHQASQILRIGAIGCNFEPCRQFGQPARRILHRYFRGFSASATVLIDRRGSAIDGIRDNRRRSGVARCS
jgi:hypothetical protein